MSVSVSFTDTSKSGPSGPIVGWEWDFGDSVGTSTEQNPAYDYATPGTYDVRLTVTGSGDDGTSSVTKPVSVA